MDAEMHLNSLASTAGAGPRGQQTYNQSSGWGSRVQSLNLVQSLGLACLEHWLFTKNKIRQGCRVA